PDGSVMLPDRRRNGAMPLYRLYYCNRDAQRFAMDDFYAMDDLEAITRPQKTAGRPSFAFEIWQGDRFVYCRAGRGGPEMKQPRSLPVFLSARGKSHCES
ncbi:MAG: hypothetical protein ACREFQ_16250, partial [Stellaceae bacterium]